MPSTSNLHDDEADRESVSELLSPSDGYFAEGHTHPGDVLIPDPSQGASQLDKEREAREEVRASTSDGFTPTPSRIDTTTPSASNARISPPQQSLSPTAASPVIATETTPLISSAPPAYSPPEPGSPYHQHARTVSTAGLYETMGRQESFFPNSSADLGGDSEALLPNRKKRWFSGLNKWWENNSRQLFSYLLLVLGVIVAIALLSELLSDMTDGRERDHGDVRHDPGDSFSIPSWCRIKDRGRVTFTWDTSPSFELIHLSKAPTRGPHQINIQTMGVIHVRTVPTDTKDALKVDVDFSYSSDAIGEDTDFVKNGDHVLSIKTPSAFPAYSLNTNRPCLWLEVTISIRADVQHDNFTVGTTSLNVMVEKNHTAKAKTVSIESLVGSITSMSDGNGNTNWGGREITIITDTGSINGAYPLYDKLHLETRTGSINTELTLHPDRYDRVSEALLFLKTISGSISASTPMLKAVEEGRGNYTIDDIPRRDYHTDVSLHSGSARLQLAHGSRTGISSNAGMVSAQLTPWLEPRKESHINVKSSTGSIDMTVRDAIAFKNEPLRNLYSDYSFSTSSLTLRYPAEWEGRVTGKLGTGHLNVDWPGLEHERQGRDEIFSRFDAKKGRGNGVLSFYGITGSARLMGKGGEGYPCIVQRRRGRLG